MGRSWHKYKQLSIEERVRVETLLGVGWSISRIARHMGRSKSTISEEIRRGRYKGVYTAGIGQKRAEKAKGKNRKPKKANDPELMQRIERMIKLRWSPEIIAHELGGKVSHTTIYSIIKKIRPEWEKYLIYRKKGKYHKGKAGKTLIPDRVGIEERPEEVEFGDWEADTVVSCKGGKSCLGVFAERTTRLYKIVKMEDKSSEEMVRAAGEALSGKPVRSITYDNGSENVKHGVINRLLECLSYFCRPYKSCDKGLVENRNKWLRVYLPKKTNFDLITEEELATIETAINDRPLKCLGWLSPSIAFSSAYRSG